MTKAIIFFLLIIQATYTSTIDQPEAPVYDVVVVGATPAGIAAAINAAREGANVLMTERTNHIGGLATGGLSNTDFNTYESVGGIWREFMDRVVEYYTENYGKDSRQVWASMDGGYYEPKVGLMIFKEMLADYENKIDILLDHRLEVVETRLKSNGFSQVEAVRIKDVVSGEIKKFNGSIFVDATYEGDLMAKAGVAYRVGGEDKTKYNESIASEEANWHVQCYNFRPTLSNDPDKENWLPITKPKGYDRKLYAPIIEYIKSGEIDDLSQIIADDRPLPNNKADFNDEKGAPISMHVCNPTDVWPEGNPATRQSIFDFIKRHNQGYLYFLQNDPELPDWIKDDMSQWGYPKDEFEDSDHWPPVVYVREGRRMIGEYIFTQHDAQPEEGSFRAPAHENSIAIGDYGLNSHGTHKPKPTVLKGELSGSSKPFQIPYGVIVPEKVDGLLVPVAVSASRVGFGAIRMEPTWAALGQAAGLAAGQALNKEIEVREISIPKLQHRLHELKAKTFYVSDVPPSSPYFEAVQYLGNRGLFQFLYRPGEVDDHKLEPRKRIDGPPSHFWTAFHYHDVDLSRQMTKPLADYWLNIIGIEDAQFAEKYEKYTRAEFLNEIYNRKNP